MTRRIAFECYADGDLVQFLRGRSQLALHPFHASGQGEVVKAVLVRDYCTLGLVDEDPGATHHRERDKAELVRATSWLEHRRRGDRHLVILKPDLERAFLRSVEAVGLDSELPARFQELHAALNVPRSPKHEVFREELVKLHDASRNKKKSTFVTELVDLLRGLA